MPKYISGRVRRTPQSQLSDVRYKYLKLDEAEPNLGDPELGTTPILPQGDQYIMVSIPGAPGERFWVPKGGGLLPGSITVYEENLLVGGISSTTQINFTGEAIKVTSNTTFTENTLTLPSNQSFNVGIAITQVDTDPNSSETVATGLVKISTDNVGFVTLTNVSGTFNTTEELYYDGNSTSVIPSATSPVIDASEQVTVEVSPEFLSTNNQVIFNDSDEFNGAEGFVYFKNQSELFNNVGLTSVGIGTTLPYRTLHVAGDIKLDGTIYDFFNDPGVPASFLVKGSTGVEWKPPTLVQTAAGGTISNVQYHGTTGLNDGASDFVYIKNSLPTPNQVGIGTTNPGSGNILDVHGKAQFNDLHSSDSEFDGDAKFIGTDSSTRYLLWDKSDNKALLTDNVKLSFGDIDDLQIYHDATDTKIENDTGKLYITNNNAIAGNKILIQPKASQDGIQILPDAEVGLYYSGSEKLKTQDDGIEITGLTDTDDLKVTGIATINTILPQSTSSGTIGTEGNKWHEIWATTINASIRGHASTAQTSVDADNAQIHYNNDNKLQFIHFGNDLASKTFDITGDEVVLNDDTINLENHNIRTGDKVTYTLQTINGDDIGGLEDGEEYYAIYEDDDNIKLATSYENATAVNPVVINLNSRNTSHSYRFVTEDRYDPVKISRDGLTYNPNTKKFGLGTNNPEYSLDFGETSQDSTIRIVSQDSGTAIRVGAGGASNSVTLLRVDGSSVVNKNKGETDTGAQGFSVKYIAGNNANNDSFSILSDNGANATQVSAVTILQDGTVGINQANPGTSYALDVNGDINASTVYANLSGNSTTATDLNETVSTGQGGKIVYQGAGANNTLFLSQPAENGTYYLSYDHTSDVPEWVDLVEATVGVGSTSKNSDHYLVFVDSNNESRGEEKLYTNPGIKVNPSTQTVAIDGGLDVEGGLTVDGNVALGDGTSDDIAINGYVTTDIIPDTNSTDANTGNTLGSQNQKWKKVYATEFQGKFIGIASEATKLENSRDFSIDGTLDVSDFDSKVTKDDNGAGFEVGINTNMFTGINTDGIKINQQLRINGATELADSVNIFPLNVKVSNIGFGTVYLSGTSLESNSQTAIVEFGYWETVGHVYAPPVSFDGTQNVVLNGNLKDQSRINPAEYGSAVQIPILTVNQQGLITDIENIGVDFTNSTVLNADNVSVGSSSEEAGSQNIYLVGVNTNNSTRSYQPLYTDGQLYYNPENDYLTTENLHVVGISSLSGTVKLGDATDDTISFNGSVDTSIIPTGTVNLGSQSSKWNKLYTNQVVGTLEGSASEVDVTELTNNFSQYNGPTYQTSPRPYGTQSSIQEVATDPFFQYIKNAYDNNQTAKLNIKVTYTYYNADYEHFLVVDSVGTFTAIINGQPLDGINIVFVNGFTYPGNDPNANTIDVTYQASTGELNVLLGNIGVTTVYADSTLKYDNITEELSTSQLKVGKILTGAGSTGSTDQVIMKNADGTWSWQTITENNTTLTSGITVYDETKDANGNISSGDAENEIQKLVFTGDTISVTVDSTDTTAGIISARDTSIQCVGYAGTQPFNISNGNDIGITTESNAYGRRFIQSSAPTAGVGQEGDIWYDVSASGGTGSGTAGTLTVTTTRITTAGIGTHTFQANLAYVKVYMLGGGGGGAGSQNSVYHGGSGAGGGLAYRIYSAEEAGTSATYTVGAGGPVPPLLNVHGRSGFPSTFTVTGTASATVLSGGGGAPGSPASSTWHGADASDATGQAGNQNSFLNFDQPVFGGTNGKGGVGGTVNGGWAAGQPGAMYIEEYHYV